MTEVPVAIGASARMSQIPRSGIRRMLERAGSADLVSLAAGDPSFDTPGFIVAAGKDALDRGATHYTHGRGIPELRGAWAEKMARENGVTGVDPGSDVVVTAGALNALAATFLAVVDPGDAVILPDPGFANYAAQVMLAGGRPLALAHPFATGFLPDLDEMDRLAEGARVMVVNTPANPTGTVLAESTLRAIAEIAIRRNLLVVADEAYEHLLYEGARHVSIASLPGMAERTITISSMSKSWAMTGWRIGFACGPAELIDAIAKVQEHLIGCPPAMTQWAALAAVVGAPEVRDHMVAEYAARRRSVLDALAGLAAFDVATPGGAFYAFPRVNVDVTGFEVAELLADEAHVLTVPGAAFGAGGARHVRISYSGDAAELADGLSRLRRWAQGPDAARHLRT